MLVLPLFEQARPNKEKSQELTGMLRMRQLLHRKVAGIINVFIVGLKPLTRMVEGMMDKTNQPAVWAPTAEQTWGEAKEMERAIGFLGNAGDTEAPSFLRRLPMVAETANSEPITPKHLIYEMMLGRFVKEAWAHVYTGYDIAGRLMQISKVYERAKNEMKKMTGGELGRPRVLDIPEFPKSYVSVT